MFRKMNWKLCLGIFMLGLVFFFSGGQSISAESISNDEFVSLQTEGIIDSEITYEDWQKIEAENEQYMKLIEEDTESIQLRAAFSLKKGDVLVTNGTSSKGLTGHAAIAITDSTILHIAGSGEKPTTLDLNKFKKKYLTKKGTWVKIYRSKDFKAAGKAADWVSKNYKGKKYKYGIDMKLDKTNPTYCSKIPWQGFRYGVGDKAVYTPGGKIITPYALPQLFKDAYNVKLVKTFNK